MKKKIKAFFDTSTTRGKVMRSIAFVLLLGLVLGLCFLILKLTGWWEKVNSMEKIRAIVEKGGAFSWIIFILFQILQTTILQIPAIFVTVAGALVFGVWPAFFMSYIAILIGSIIMFIIGRRAGRRFLYWIVGKETAEHWIHRMSHGKYLFFLMMVFPLFPDDILCVVAGLTDMQFSFFIFTNLIARGIGLLCTVYFGTGAIIPFHGWGLIVWAVILCFVGVLFYLSVKYKEKIDEILDAMFKKKQKKTKEKEK